MFVTCQVKDTDFSLLCTIHGRFKCTWNFMKKIKFVMYYAFNKLVNVVTGLTTYRLLGRVHGNKGSK